VIVSANMLTATVQNRKQKRAFQHRHNGDAHLHIDAFYIDAFLHIYLYILPYVHLLCACKVAVIHMLIASHAMCGHFNIHTWVGYIARLNTHTPCAPAICA